MYNPKIWYDGDIVTSGGLNNMEQGIAQNAHDIEDLQGALGGDMESYVDSWLDSHPEATTTVQDGAVTTAKLASGSVTEAKLSDALKLKSIKDYVTPEMFGAKGDGVSDDTQAIQDAIDTGKDVYFADKTYVISEPIKIVDKFVKHYDGIGATLAYTGTDHAILITGSKHITVRFGEIQAYQGDCIYILSNQDVNYSQYINIYFDRLEANSDTGSCVKVQMDGKWINEVNLFGGMFARGKYGFWDENFASPYVQDHFKFYNCAVEGVDIGYYLGSNVGMQDYQFFGCRHIETKTSLFVVDATARKFRYYGSSELNTDWINIVNGDMDGSVFFCPIKRSGSGRTADYMIVRDTFFQLCNLGTNRVESTYNNLTNNGFSNAYDSGSLTGTPFGKAGYVEVFTSQMDNSLLQVAINVSTGDALATRRYDITKNTWTNWNVLDFGVTYSELNKSISGMGGAIVSSVSGHHVAISGEIGLTADVASETEVASGCPIPTGTTKPMVLFVKADGTVRRCTISSTGALISASTINSGYYKILGSYIK